jgi:hypothetical protein
MVYVIQVWHIRAPLLCVQWKTPDDGQRKCPKHVEFHSKIKFWKLVHLVGSLIRNVQHVRIPRSYKQMKTHYNVKTRIFILSNNILQHNHKAKWCTCPTLAISFTTTHIVNSTSSTPIRQHHSEMSHSTHRTQNLTESFHCDRPDQPSYCLSR